MTKKESDVPIRKSDRIAQIIARANQVAAIDWLHAILEEQAEPLRSELDDLRALTSEQHPVMPVMDVKAIEAPKESARHRASQARWNRMTKKERAEQLSKMAAARWKKKSAGVSGYWAKMTPEERSVEMKRRMAMHGQPKLTLAERLKLHPRDKRSPKHVDWLRTIQAAQKRRFDSMTVREKKEWQTAMQQGHEQRANGAAL